MQVWNTSLVSLSTQAIQDTLDKILLATSEDEIKALGANIKDSPVSHWIKRMYLPLEITQSV